MKINIAYPATGCLKKLEIDDDHKLRVFYDKRISNEIVGEALGDEFKGYILKIKGGCDNQGFPMKHGVLTPGRVRLLLVRGTPCFVVLEGEMVNAEGNLYWLYCEPMPFSYQLGHCEEGRQRSSWAH